MAYVKKAILKRENDALKISVREGATSSLSSGIADPFITPFALEIGAKPLHIGLLSSFSILLSQLAQYYGSNLMEHHSRKKIVAKYVFLLALMWLPIAGLSFFAWKGIITGYLPYMLIVGYSLLSIFGGVLYPSWFSWMGDIVPEDRRGRYFSRRNIIAGSVALIGTLAAGTFLKVLRTEGMVLLGFSTLFILAFFLRIRSYYLLKKQFCPEIKIPKKAHFSFISFVKRYDNFGKFAVYQGFFNLAIMIASPFFAVYMLEELKFNYLFYTLVTISSTVFYLLFTPLVGKFSDKYGNLKLLFVANIALALNPLLWTIIKKPILIMIIPQLITGLGNAALTISFTNFTYNSVKKEHRGLCIAYTNIIIGAGTFVGAMIGGLLLNYLQTTFINKFILVFILAGITRFLVAAYFLPQLKEKKKGKNFHHLHLNFMNPFRTVKAELSHISQGLKVIIP